jgi:hypothetical protein
MSYSGCPGYLELIVDIITASPNVPFDFTVVVLADILIERLKIFVIFSIELGLRFLPNPKQANGKQASQ